MNIPFFKKKDDQTAIDQTLTDQTITTQQKQSLADQFSIVGVKDPWSSYPSTGLTPQRLVTMLREADTGDVWKQMELFTEMLEKDGHLMSLFGHIRIVVTGKNYEVLPGSNDAEDIEIASEAQKMFGRVKGWRTCCGHILDCSGKAFSANQNIWKNVDNRLDFVGMRYIDQKNYRYGKASDPHRDMQELRLLVDPFIVEKLRGIVPDELLMYGPAEGIPLDASPAFRQLFTVALSLLRSSSPARAALLRTCAYAFMFKNYDIKWWVKFAELMLGIRVGKYDSSRPEDKKVITDAVRNMAQDAALVITKDSEVQFLEMMTKAASHQTYTELKDYCNDEMTKAVLLHAAANQAIPGKLGNDSGAEDALQILYEYYGGILDEAVTDDILRVWVINNWGERDNYPSYHTQVEKPGNLLQHAELIVLLQKTGKQISKKYVDNKFGIPSPDPTDPNDEALVPMKNSSFPDPSVAAKNGIDSSAKELLRKFKYLVQ
jgi:phage gp29-like protein